MKGWVMTEEEAFSNDDILKEWLNKSGIISVFSDLYFLYIEP